MVSWKSIILKDRKESTWIREESKIRDIIEQESISTSTMLDDKGDAREDP